MFFDRSFKVWKSNKTINYYTFSLILLILIKYIWSVDRSNDYEWKEGISPDPEFSKTSAD